MPVQFGETDREQIWYDDAGNKYKREMVGKEWGQWVKQTETNCNKTEQKFAPHCTNVCDKV